MNLRKIIREEMEDDFGWIRDIPAFLPGKYFDDNNVCIDVDDDCEVTIQDDKIVFNIDLDEFISRWGSYDDEYYLKPLIQNSWAGEIYDGDGDYYEFDSDEFNYSGYQVEDQLRRRFTDFIMEVDKDLDSDDVNNFFNDHMLGIEDHLRYPRLYNDFDNLVGEVLSALGYAVQENRWLSISRTFINRMEQIREMGVEVEFEHGRWGHENLIITVPMEVVNQIHRKKQFKDLSELYAWIISPINDISWADWFYDEWDSSGASDRINEAWRVFLDNAEDYLENEDYQEERKFVDYCYDVLKSKGWVLRGDGPNRFNKVDPNIRTLTHNLDIDSLKSSFIKSRGFINGKTWNSRQNSWRDSNEITTEIQNGDIYETFKKFLDEVESRAGIKEV